MWSLPKALQIKSAFPTLAHQGLQDLTSLISESLPHLGSTSLLAPPTGNAGERSCRTTSCASEHGSLHLGCTVLYVMYGSSFRRGVTVLPPLPHAETYLFPSASLLKSALTCLSILPPTLEAHRGTFSLLFTTVFPSPSLHLTAWQTVVTKVKKNKLKKLENLRNAHLSGLAKKYCGETKNAGGRHRAAEG